MKNNPGINKLSIRNCAYFGHNNEQLCKLQRVETTLITLTPVTIGGQLQIPLLLGPNYVDIDRNRCVTQIHEGCELC